MKVKGIETRQVEVEISEKELIDKLYEIFKLDPRCYIKDGKLLIKKENRFYDEFAEHSSEQPYVTDIYSSNQEDVEMFKAIRLIHDRLAPKQNAGIAKNGPYKKI